MKNFLNLRMLAVFAAVLSIPHFACGATKTWVTLAAAPATTNITSGIATTLTATLTWRNGSGASARFVGPALLDISVQPPDPSITIGLSQTNYTFPNVDTTYTPTLTFATTALTPSNTYVVTIIGNTNPPTPANPNVLPVTNTFTVTMISGGPFNPVKVWTPAGANTNWSTAGNWSPAGAPGSTNDVKFYDPGAVSPAGTTNSDVDANFTIGSLTYGQTNQSHTTLIPSGMTLTISGANGLAVGTGTDNGDFQLTTAAISGQGAALVLNNANAIVNVGQAFSTVNNAISSAQAVLDLSGLDTFTASASRLLVGGDFTIKGSCGVLNLARTNRITLGGATAPQIDIGDNTQGGGTPTIPSILRLGQTNAFFVDSIGVGRGKTDATGCSIAFNSSFANPVALFRGTGVAGSRVGLWSIGDAYGSRTYWTYGTCDFSLGRVDALVDTMYVGKGASVALGSGANNPGTGTLTLNAGTMDVNTLEVGYSIDGTGTGTVNVNGGLLSVNTVLELAHGASAAGTLNISSGTVTANNGITAGGGSASITLTNGTLNVTNATATMGAAGAPISTLAMTDSTLTVAARDLGPVATLTALSAGGTVNTLNISGVPAITTFPAQYRLIAYASSSGNLNSFVLGTLPSGSSAYQGYVSNNVANSSIDLVITNGPVFYPLIWAGTPNGDWDINTTANWKSNGIAAKYQQNYALVRFDDTLTGTNGVNLITTLTPGSVIVNNSAANYTFSGAGKLSGSASLTKSGTGTLTLAETGGNDFSNGVALTGGKLQVGSGGTGGSLGSGAVSAGAGTSLVFDRSDSVAVPNNISGFGRLTQDGAGILALNGSNSAFAGEIVVAHGTLQAGNISALGTAAVPVTVSNGATLDVYGQKFNNSQPITAFGAGVGGNGAIVNNSTNSPNQILRNVMLAGNTIFGGSSAWDIHSSSNAASDAVLSTLGNAYKLTKVGGNTVSIFGAQVDNALGDIVVQAGTLSFERLTSSLGNPANTVTVFTNATLQFANASNIWNKVVVLQDGAALRAVNQAEFAGPVTLQSGEGTFVANTAGAQLLLDAVVSGAGGLTKDGAGGLTLASASTYTGPTLVSAGVLALTNSGSINTSTNITVSAGAALDLFALANPTLTLTSGRALKGSGSVLGSVTMASGSTLAAGGPGTNTVGTLTVTNGLVLQAGSTTLMEVSKVGTSPVNDQLVATNVTYGGTLNVTGIGGAFATGDTFKLFSAGSYGASFGLVQLPVGTTWDTSNLNVDGTIKVISVTRPQVTGIAQANGNMQLSLSGPAGNSYRVWASTNVAATPVTSTWSLLVTNGLFNPIGTASFVDTSASSYRARFYVISVP